MSEVDGCDDKKSKSYLELNNNAPINLGVDKSLERKRNSVSSASSASDTSEDVEKVDFDDSATKTNDKKFSGRKLRSMSDGQAGAIAGQDLIDIFPSLPDSVLKKLGLLGEASKERINEEEIEQKFISLALAFTIDSTTIRNRCERQRRYRDQTELNLFAEIDKLIEKITFIQPLFVDASTAELLAGLLAQIDVLMKAASHAAISAERYGAVQHEEKLSDAVNLMINHVTLLKQQRDSARKQLQYTKRVLQDTNSTDVLNKARVANGRVGAGRRASIATVSQAADVTRTFPVATTEIRRITRRTSDLSTRVSSFARSARPNRLELGLDLDKIKEGIALSHNLITLPQTLEKEEVEETHVELPQSFRHRTVRKVEELFKNLEERYERNTKDGSLHEFFYFGSLLCFSLGVVVLANVLLEFELGRADAQTQKFGTYWNYLFKLDFDEQ